MYHDYLLQYEKIYNRMKHTCYLLDIDVWINCLHSTKLSDQEFSKVDETYDYFGFAWGLNVFFSPRERVLINILIRAGRCGQNNVIKRT